MAPKFLPLLLVAALLAGPVACKKGQTDAEKKAALVEKFRTKQKGEAIKAYTALTTQFPDSEFAAKAKERLDTLGPMPATPAPKKK